MIDYGSGRYRLQLVHRKPAADKSDAIDTTEIEIYNPKYPPLIPRDVWMNDPRNKRWEALLKPKEAPAPPAGAGVASVTEAFDTLTKIRKDMREELTPPAVAAPPPPPDPVLQFRTMLQTAKEMMPAPAPATDNKVLDTVVQLMMKQLDASQSETKELRAEMRDMMKTRQADHGETFETIVDKFEKLAPKLQSLLGLGGEKLTDVVHGRRRDWWQELLISAAPGITPGLNSLMGAAANYFMMPKGGLGAPPQPNPGQQALPAPANGQPAPQAQPDALAPLKQKVGYFLQSNLSPMNKAFEDFLKKRARNTDDPDEGTYDGSDFAVWVAEYHDPQILRDARSLGSANIVEMFKAAPAVWAAIAPKETQFRQFLDQILAYSPDEEEPEPPEGKPVDLTDQD